MGSFAAVILIVLSWNVGNTTGIPDDYNIYAMKTLAQCEKLRESYAISRNIEDADAPLSARGTWTADCEMKLAGTTYNG